MRKISLFFLCAALLLTVNSALAQNVVDPEELNSSFLSLVGSALAWATFAIVVSQGTSILIMWGLGLPPSKLTHEIEDVQNPAVGAFFFIISLIASIFVGFMTTSGFTPDPSTLESAAWIIGGLVIASLYTALIFMIAHRMMGRQPNENVYDYIRREVIKEQNAAVAFFLGGLAVTPFISTVFQLL